MCVLGDPLVSYCDPCVTQVCAADSSCCGESWDQLCIDEVAAICGIICGAPICGDGGLCQQDNDCPNPQQICDANSNTCVEPGEECDDGNTIGGDGCSATCTIEVFECNDGIDNDGDGGCDSGGCEFPPKSGIFMEADTDCAGDPTGSESGK